MELYIKICAVVLTLVGSMLLIRRFKVHVYGRRVKGTLAKTFIRESREYKNAGYTRKTQISVIEFHDDQVKQKTFEDGLIHLWTKPGSMVNVVYDPNKHKSMYVDHWLCIYAAPAVLIGMSTVMYVFIIKKF